MELRRQICEHGKLPDEYCFDCVRKQHNEDVLDGRFDEDERPPPATSKSVDELAREIAEKIVTKYGYLDESDFSAQVEAVAAIVAPYLADEKGVCEWKSRPSTWNQNKLEWSTTCGVSTEVFNSCASYCCFCGRPAPPVVEEVTCVKCGRVRGDEVDQLAPCDVDRYCVFPTATPADKCKHGVESSAVCELCDYDAADAATEGGDEVQNNSVDAAQNLGVPRAESQATSALSAEYWDRQEADAQVRFLRSFHAVKAEGGDVVAVAAESAAHWNRMYRELLANPTTQATGGLPSQDVPDHSVVSALPKSSSEPAPESQGVGIAGNEQAHSALHKLWTKAVGQSNYDKSEWRELERVMYLVINERDSLVKQRNEALDQCAELHERLARY